MLAEIIQLIQSDTWRMECLEAVDALGLPDWYIAAGFLRNAIWDALHAKSARTPLNDVDVVYYDLGDHGTAAEAQIESVLRARGPTVTWEARNQARMHLRNGHTPYRDSAHAIAHWIETPTCVGVRIGRDRGLEIVAPYGLAENWSLRVAPNPRIRYPAALFTQRVREKRWLEYWPQLRVEWPSETHPAPALAVFDLDGTLLRGRTVCELLAEPLGRLDRMQQLERFSTEADLAAARERDGDVVSRTARLTAHGRPPCCALRARHRGGGGPAAQKRSDCRDRLDHVGVCRRVLRAAPGRDSLHRNSARAGRRRGARVAS